MVIAISLFDNPDEALMSNENAADWVRNNVMKLVRGTGLGDPMDSSGERDRC